MSAFSPIVAPTQCPWGEKALGNYLGDDREEWQAYDACALLDPGLRVPDLLVDQGSALRELRRHLTRLLQEQETGHAVVDPFQLLERGEGRELRDEVLVLDRLEGILVLELADQQLHERVAVELFGRRRGGVLRVQVTHGVDLHGRRSRGQA